MVQLLVQLVVVLLQASKDHSNIKCERAEAAHVENWGWARSMTGTYICYGLSAPFESSRQIVFSIFFSILFDINLLVLIICILL